MKIGVQLPLHVETTDGPSIRRFIMQVERFGYDSVWLGDHIVLPDEITDLSSYPYLWRFSEDIDDLFPRKSFAEATAMASYVAGVSTRLEIGVGVFVVPMRNPVLLAKQLATIDVLSEGRLIAGIGAGWMREEFQALGAEFKRRGARMDESVDLMRALWSDQQPIRYRGTFYSFDEIYCQPTPVRACGIPLWIGGHSPRALRRCARYGDGWHGIELSPKDFGDYVQRIDDLTIAEGRSPEDVTKSVAARLTLSSNVGKAAETVRDYEYYGCEHLVVYVTPSRSIDENLHRFSQLSDELAL